MLYDQSDQFVQIFITIFFDEIRPTDHPYLDQLKDVASYFEDACSSTSYTYIVRLPYTKQVSETCNPETSSHPLILFAQQPQSSRKDIYLGVA